jgi:hypothetical protein
MIVWPEAIVAEIAERRCIIFLGAGASASSTSPQGGIRPPLWMEFVEHSIGKVAENGVKKLAKRMVKQNRLLEAAELITTSMPRADFGLLVSAEFEAPKFQPSRLHECVRALDVKVVVTSNYDDIYDRLCLQGEGGELYKVVRYHDGNLMELLRSATRIIIKMHGSVTDTTSLVLSQSQYHEARRNYPHFFRVLDALFTVSTVLFIGCSLEALRHEAWGGALLRVT